MRDPIVIKLENITLRVRDTFLLPNTNWQIDKGQHWAILGPNGAGKTSLVKALTGEVAVVRGTIYSSHELTRAGRAAYVSFEQHQRLIEREERRDESRYFSGDLNRITTVYEILLESCEAPGSSSIDVERMAADLKIPHLLEREIRVLSTGEMRKVQIARILINSPEILILDEPFDGCGPFGAERLLQAAGRRARDHRDDRPGVMGPLHRELHLLGRRSGGRSNVNSARLRFPRSRFSPGGHHR